MTDVDAPASSGWILWENNSAVSHAGWLDASQDERAFACRRSDSACFARASGLRAATRPIRAAFARRSVAPSTAQFAQWFRSGLMAFPQPLQTCSGFGRFTLGTSLSATSRLSRCVSRVAINCRVSLSLEVALDTDDQSSCATYSATGATSLRQVSEVSQSLIASDDAMRQFPLRSSEKSDLQRGSL
jgi:hypothetical protein